MTRSPEISGAVVEDVKAVVVITLHIEDRADDLGPETALNGNLPELDSLTVIKLIVALQKRFGIEIEIDEIIGDIFGTLGLLAAFVESKLPREPFGGVRCHEPPGEYEAVYHRHNPPAQQPLAGEPSPQ